MNNDLPNAPEPAEPLDALLRDADEYVPDSGFTARVLASLPPRRRRPWLRLAILATTTLLASALAAWQLPPVSDLLTLAVQGISQFRPAYLLALLPAIAALAAILWGVLEMVREEE